MIELYPYTISLKTKVNGQKERKGVLVSVSDNQGNVGWGDAAPLLGFSQETVKEVLAKKECASLQWAEDVAKCHLESQQKNVSMFSLWSNSPNESLPITKLGITIFPFVTGESHNVGGGVFRSGSENSLSPFVQPPLEKEEYVSIKIKVGRQLLEKDISLVEEYIHKYAPQQIRLDANRVWHLNEAIDFCKAMKDYPIEFIEEPCQNPQDIPELVRQTQIPVALDESIYLKEDISALWDFIVAIVLKPTLVGGIDILSKWKQEAERRDKYIVVSAAFESGVGIYALSQLALAWHKPNVSVGLDTYSFLKSDVLEEHLKWGQILSWQELPPIQKTILQ